MIDILDIDMGKSSWRFSRWMALKKRYELFPTPNITGKPVFDDRIVTIETYTYNPFALQHSGTAMIRIPIQQ